MKTILMTAATLFALSAHAAPVKTYQVTGPVLEVTDKSITVEKGKDKWEIALDPANTTKIVPKKGDKVTIQYYMTATDVELKTAKKK